MTSYPAGYSSFEPNQGNENNQFQYKKKRKKKKIYDNNNKNQKFFITEKFGTEKEVSQV